MGPVSRKINCFVFSIKDCIVAAKKVNRVPVLVTTQFRGVFFGFVDPSDKANKSLTLTDCRCCISWASSVGGFLGLAAKGPDGNCKIGTQAPAVLLHDITSVTDCTESAVEAWTRA